MGGWGTQPQNHPPQAVLSGAGEVLSPRPSRQSTERTWYLPLGQRGELCRVGDDMHIGSAGAADDPGSDPGPGPQCSQPGAVAPAEDQLGGVFGAGQGQ